MLVFVCIIIAAILFFIWLVLGAISTSLVRIAKVMENSEATKLGIDDYATAVERGVHYGISSYKAK